MTLDLTLLDWLGTLVMGAAIAFAAGVGTLLLFRTQGSRAANLSMGGFLWVAALAAMYVLLLSVQPPGENLGIVFAPLPFTFAAGPLLYAYVRARMGQGLLSPLHAIAPLAQAVVVVGIGLAPLAVKQWYMGNVLAPWWAVTELVLTVLSLGGYLGASWWALRRGSDPAPEAWRRRRDAWLRRLLLGVTGVLGVLVVLGAVGIFSGSLGVGRSDLSFMIERAVYVLALVAGAMAGLVQAEVRIETTAASPPEAPDGPLATREPTLLPEQAESLRGALARLIETERPHLDPDLSLASLAQQIGATDKTLSALLNETMGTTYTAYVNRLRVDEARQRLADPEHAHYSVLAIGLDAGFASKSTFNRVFKETTGQTPSAYRAASGAST